MTDMSERTQPLHASSTIIDGLQISRWSEEVFLNQRRGGLTAVNATVAVIEGFHETIRSISRWYRMFDQYHSLIRPVRTVKDIDRAKEEGKTGIIFGFQNTSPIEDDLDRLAIFKELGVRVIQLTYMERNYVGDGCLERTDCGLSRFGMEVIEEMNRLGILIDLSHVGDRTVMEAIEASKKPVAFTHANPRGLCNHPRNKTDEQIKALAKKGGVIGANVFPPFLSTGSKATMKEVIDAIDYLVALVGMDHVGIGTDFTEGQPRAFFDTILKGKSKKELSMDVEYPIVNPEGIRSSADFPNLTQALLARGYSESDTKKVMGENFLRLFREAWE
jgi:membrane dipeptidase